MADVFLSYKKVDKPRVVALARALETHGFTVWWDHELESGQKWLDRILEEVDIARALVGVWSAQSVQRGQFVESEDSHNYLLTEHMRAGTRKVLGAMFDPGVVPALYSGSHAADFVGWDGLDRDHPGFRNLVGAVESKAVPAFAERRILEARGETLRIRDELHRARMQADESRRRAERLSRQLAEATEHAERLSRDLGTAETRLQAASGWEAREDALRRSLAQDLQQARASVTAADGARALVARERDAAVALAKAAEASRIEVQREQDAAMAEARAAQAEMARERDTAAGRVRGVEWRGVTLGWCLSLLLVWKVGPHRTPVRTESALAAATSTSVNVPHQGSEWDHQDVVGWMRHIPAGTFTMGSPTWEVARDDDEGPQHQVAISGFWLMESEVTQRMWLDVMGSSPSAQRTCLDCPVEQVSWDDAQSFIAVLNARTGRTYRLATEAEWEYAARGDESHFYAGASEPGVVAWYDQNSGRETHPVCGKQRNGFGLCDMSGNVWEWCLDGKRTYSAAAATDPRGPMGAGSSRVIRGGSWNFTAAAAGVSWRDFRYPAVRTAYLGLRLARSE